MTQICLDRYACFSTDGKEIDPYFVLAFLITSRIANTSIKAINYKGYGVFRLVGIRIESIFTYQCNVINKTDELITAR